MLERVRLDVTGLGMKRAAVAIALGLVLSAVLPPATVIAGGAGHAPRSPGGSRPVGALPSRGVVTSGGHHGHGGHIHRHHGRFHHRHFPAFVPYTFFSYVPPVAYSAPAVVSPSIVVNTSPTVYAPIVVNSGPAPVAAAAPAPAAAPMPTLVEYATGRYELRGDGLSVPYVWVWIPNPPLAPPPQVAEEPPARAPSRETSSKVYRWTDEDGTTILTNRPDTVPERYRSRSEPTRSAAADPS
jgi:uncharacterized protein DUF4124